MQFPPIEIIEQTHPAVYIFLAVLPVVSALIAAFVTIKRSENRLEAMKLNIDKESDARLGALVKDAQEQLKTAYQVVIDTMRGEITLLKDDYLAAMEKVRYLEGSNDRTLYQLDETKRKLTDIEDRLRKAEKALQVEEALNAKLSKENDGLREENGELRQENHALKLEITELKSQMAEMQARLTILEQTSAAAVDVATLKEEINVVKKQTTGQLPPLESVLPSGTEKKENAA
jgi:chromosome segregation ATPase